jgi:rod shape-determining protein MreC
LKEPQPSFSRVAQPIRNFAQRFAYIGLVLLAFGLMLLAKVDTLLLERVRIHMTDAVAPILEVVSKPIDSVNRGIAELQAMKNLYADNDRLRTERERLLHWKAVAEKLEAENRVLRDHLNSVQEVEPRFITARVIADTGGAFSQSVIINAGAREGIKRGQAAVTANGLAGRVIDVGHRSARVLLVTDINAKIPVLIDPSRTRAIMAGSNKASTKLTWLPPGAVVAVGDRIVTSGHAGVFPPGIPVGQVVSVGENGLLVQPFADLSRLEYLRVLEFGTSGMLQMPKRKVGVEVPASMDDRSSQKTGAVQ